MSEMMRAGDHGRLSFGEDAGLGCPDAGDVSDGEHPWVGGLECEGINRDPSLDGHA